MTKKEIIDVLKKCREKMIIARRSGKLDGDIFIGNKTMIEVFEEIIDKKK